MLIDVGRRFWKVIQIFVNIQHLVSCLSNNLEQNQIVICTEVHGHELLGIFTTENAQKYTGITRRKPFLVQIIAVYWFLAIGFIVSNSYFEAENWKFMNFLYAMVFWKLGILFSEKFTIFDQYFVKYRKWYSHRVRIVYLC